MIRTCINCGVKHKTRRAKDRVKFCSKSCRDDFENKEKSKICLVCNTAFIAREKTQQTCSKSCAIFHTKQSSPIINDEDRRCKNCNVVKPILSYYRKKTGFQTICKDCTKIRTNEHWQQNKTKQIERSANRRKEMWSWYTELKGMLVCNKCGEDHPAVLDFHHSDPRTKEASVGKLIKNLVSKHAILAEINKCEVLCSNCHRKHHWDERHNQTP